MKYFQQGDVLIKPLKKIPEDAEPLGTNIVAYGESTGHAHKFENWGEDFGMGVAEQPSKSKAKNYILSKKDNVIYLRVPGPEPATLLHNTHDKVDVPPGDYFIDYVQEYHHFEEESKRVAD